MLPLQGHNRPVAPEEVLFRQHSNQINMSLTGFGFEHSLSTSHPEHEGNDRESKSSSNYVGESGSHSWWPFNILLIRKHHLFKAAFRLIFNLLWAFVSLMRSINCRFFKGFGCISNAAGRRGVGNNPVR